jgi:mRNA interferase MazF
MGPFTAGQVVLVRFPFSDLTASKLRPAIVLAEAGCGDWILGQITSKSYGDPKAIEVNDADFNNGSLRVTSFVRPGKLFTAHTSLVTGILGELGAEKFNGVRDAVVKMIQNG